MFSNPNYRAEKTYLATSFAILFLVRSSEVLTQPGGDSELLGGIGFKKDTELRAKNGVMVTFGSRKESQRNDGNDEAGWFGRRTTGDADQILEESRRRIQKKDNKSRGEIKAFLRSMVAARNYYRRLIAVRFLGGEQDMDNVPALIYALGIRIFGFAWKPTTAFV